MVIIQKEWNFSPRILSGETVQLEPLTSEIFDETCAAMIPDPHGWYSLMFGLDTPEAYKQEFSDAANFLSQKTGMGFAIRDLKTRQIAGITFFLKMDNENRSLEIGTTNIAPKFRRSHVNTAVKLLMLQHAFEELKCIRVVFRVDEGNTTSRKAVERLGAKFGGLLRYERILPNGQIRNYCFYSIIDSEWAEVKKRLSRNHRCVIDEGLPE